MAARPDPVGRRSDAAHDIAGWLGLAAAPTCGVMAVVQVAARPDSMGMLCMTAAHATPLTGMAAMYLLMGLFHAGPWMRLVRSRRLRRPARAGDAPASASSGR